MDAGAQEDNVELDKAKVKNYFERDNTVSRWWDPEEKPGLFRDLYVKQRQLLKELVDPKEKLVLDAGTGKGRFAIDFALGGAKAVYATDISGEMLEIAEKRAESRAVADRIKFQATDIENLKFDDGFFDVACCMETFVHLPSPPKAMRELTRVVRPGGIVVSSVTLPIKSWYLNLGRISNLNQLFEWVFTPIYQSRVYQNGIRRILRRPKLVGRPLEVEFFKSLFIDCNLSIERIIYLGHPKAPHFVLILARK